MAISGTAASLPGRHSTAPAARTALLAGTALGEVCFGNSTPGDHSRSEELAADDLKDADEVPSKTPDGRAPSHPRVATPSTCHPCPTPSTVWPGQVRIRRHRSAARPASDP